MGIFDYQASIEILFDRVIESNPEIITGTEYYRIMQPYDAAWTLLSSGDNASYPKGNAFDGETTTFWRSSATTAPQWIGKDFGQDVSLTKIGVQMDYSAGRINAYEIQGSANGVDWKSFRLQISGALGVNTTPLELISHDRWSKDFRPADEDTSTSGLGVPSKVFKSHGTGINGGFGITPSPNAAYVILYDYFSTETSLALHSDSVTIPSRFDFVIINGALKNFYMFKENTEQATFWAGEFDKTLSQMKLNLNPRKDDVTDTRVNFGGRWNGR